MLGAEDPASSKICFHVIYILISTDIKEIIENAFIEGLPALDSRDLVLPI
jgi:hypothetical protein